MLHPLIHLTLFDPTGAKSADVYIAVTAVISINPANPTGSVVNCTRGAYHVKQSVDQIIRAMGSPIQN